MRERAGQDIAIIGMAGRFPGARNIDQFWQNLENGRESISFFTEDELLAEGVDPKLLRNPNYVKARSLIEDIELFDSDFFGINPKEAESMDPQHRIFLETAWDALENAGYDADRYKGAIGVYAGAFFNTYLLNNLCSAPGSIGDFLGFSKVGGFQAFLGNDKDHLSTRVAYKMNLKGPAITMQSACSTSLVSICQAVANLLSYQCDIALAGGITITSPKKRGYLYDEGGMVSPDGHCRAFDAKAQGTVFGSGVGIVVLKRLEDALSESDNIIAVIKGAALNNDGSQKVSYTAPSVDGQAEAIMLAHALAGVSADTISYVEAHGTGTPLGDPIEIAGLTQAFRATTDKRNFCAIGSVKTNIGHLDVASGVVGLIKTVLALKHKKIPPTLHFESANPNINFTESPFFVNSRLTEWTTNGHPRRAGVSSFGVGGTNAHVVIEEAPNVKSGNVARRKQLIILSAKTEQALDQRTRDLVSFLKNSPEMALSDVAYTLHVGRKSFDNRRMLVAADTTEAIRLMENGTPGRMLSGCEQRRNRPVVFMFPGQGSQYVNMARGLYESEKVFRDDVATCAELLKPLLDLDIRDVIFPPADRAKEAEELLANARVAQPSIFIIEFALARLWMSWGIKPAAMIGHSVGEYVAACISGVFDLADAVHIVASRARLVQEQPGGAMLAVRLSESDLQALLPGGIEIAASNSPTLTVASGSFDRIEALELKLKGQGVAAIRLKTSHAFHSSMMEPVVPVLTEFIRKVPLQEPKIPFVSTVTGDWVSSTLVKSPDYWANHLRQTVRFNDAIRVILEDEARLLLEVGPGNALSTFARQHAVKDKSCVIGSLPINGSSNDDVDTTLNALGRLWLAGVEPDWESFHNGYEPRRVSLPTYPFERKRYWVDAQGDFERTDVLPEVDEMRSRVLENKIYTSGNEIASTNSTALIAREIRLLLQEMSGVEMKPSDDNVSFTEKGFDSLFLTQIRVSFETRFGVKLTAHQLREELSSVNSLACFIEKHQPETIIKVNRNTLQTSKSTGTDNPGVSTSVLQQLDSLRQDIARLHSLISDIARSDRNGSSKVGIDECERKELDMTDTREFASQRILVSPVPEKAGTDLNRSFPLTYAQRELWIVSQSDPKASCAYNESEVIELSGNADVAILSDSVRELVMRHESLRTRFSTDGNCQTVMPAIDLDIPVTDLTQLRDGELESQFNLILEREGELPFDLIKGPPIRAQVVKLTNERHALIFTAHHIVCDGWAMSVLLQELGEIYSAKVQRRPLDLPAPFQFADFERRLREKKEEAEQSESYWVRQFPAEIPILEMPTDFPRNSTRSFRGGRVEETIPQEQITKMKAAAAKIQCTPYVFFLSVFQVMLSRWSQQRDIVIGMPVAGQTITGEERLVGHCINVLPLRKTIEENRVFSSHVKETWKEVSEALDHPYFTFSQLIEKFNVPRDPSRVPIVQATFNLNRPFNELAFGSLEVRVLALPQRRHNFDISFHLVEINGNMVVQCRYNADVFSQESIERLVRSYRVLLESFVRDSNQTVGNASLLSKDELDLVLDEWNQTTTDYPKKCIHELFEEQVTKTPEAIAVSFDGQEMTYAELNDAANQLAYYLRNVGVQPNKPVGFCVERSFEMIVGLLAILKAGGAYLTIDPSYPRERLAQMIRDADVQILVTMGRFKELAPVNVRVLCLDEDASSFAGEKTENPINETTPYDLAYVIFTSGSTGVPKGVCVPHRGVVRLVRDTNYIQLSRDDSFLQFAPIAFDASTFEIWGSLLNGAKLVIFPPNFDSLDQLGGVISKERISVLWLTAGLFHQMIADQSESLRGVKLLLAGGDVLSPSAVADALRLLPNTTLINGYGPTENTTFTCCYTVPRDFKGDHPVPIGKPISNTRVYVLDKNLQLVPIGVPGELFIGGDGLAHGYLNSGELTAQKFIADPFDSSPGALLYRTGDLVKWLPSGDIEFIGRFDSQVKIRGFRVELGEIENVIGRQPGVRQCVVTLRKAEGEDSILVAYVVPNVQREQKTYAADLKAALKRKLPDYMVPRAFVVLDELPLNNNGKVDQKALPPPIYESEQLAAPRTPSEEFLLDVWRKVIGREQIGVFDNFFDLGGHSLLMTQIVSRIRATLDVDLPIGAIFNAPTVASLAEVLDEKLLDDVNTDKRGERISA